jgi:hypothetical protein
VSKRLDILLDRFEMQRIQQHVFALGGVANAACDPEKKNREKNQDAEYQTEGVEELAIGRFGLGHYDSLKIGGKRRHLATKYSDTHGFTE